MLTFTRFLEEVKVSLSMIRQNPFEREEMLSRSPDAYKWMEIYDRALQQFEKNYAANPTGPVTLQLAQVLQAAHQGDYAGLMSIAKAGGAGS